jgi:kynurenine formamidase
MAETKTDEAYVAWLEGLAERLPFGAKDRRGTANYIDDAARRRAAAAITTGRTATLARPLGLSGENAVDYEGPLAVDLLYHDITASLQGGPLVGGAVHTAGDTLTVVAHGQRKTHLDGINHFGRLGSWYSGFPVDDPDGPEIADLADHKLFTRGVVVDVPAVRGTEWVDVDAPVTGEDIDASLDAAGVTFEPGDALLLYMGRDRYEAAGQQMNGASGTATPGAGAGAARWIAEHQVSVLCWDFLDAIHPSQPSFPVHLLIWAVGLLLVDNCHLRPAVDATAESGSAVGGLVVAPPPLPRATSCLVGPLFIQ